MFSPSLFHSTFNPIFPFKTLLLAWFGEIYSDFLPTPLPNFTRSLSVLFTLRVLWLFYLFHLYVSPRPFCIGDLFLTHLLQLPVLVLITHFVRTTVFSFPDLRLHLSRSSIETIVSPQPPYCLFPSC